MNVKEIKEEIKEEESFLLRLFQLEKLIRKYKYQLIAFVIIVILGVVGIQVKNYLHTQMLIKTNNAYEYLLLHPKDKDSISKLNTLKENKKLYKLYLLQTSNNDVSKLKEVIKEGGIIADIASYQLAMLTGKKEDIEKYSLKIGAVYKNLALLNLERIYLKEGNHKKAEEIAKQIDDVDISSVAVALLHYGIAK